VNGSLTAFFYWKINEFFEKLLEIFNETVSNFVERKYLEDGGKCSNMEVG